jgi:gas vesicle protein
MLRTVRMALKYTTLGLLAGVVLAPRKGKDTRDLVAKRTKQLIHDVVTPDK